MVRPVKNKANGTNPPITPTAISFPICFLDKVLISFHLEKLIIMPIIASATIPFFKVVKTIGLGITVTAIFVRKLLVPEIRAVKSAR